MRTLIIAEAGINHNRDMNMAVQLIDAAKASGADVVKFQLEVGGDYCPTFDQMKHIWLYCKTRDMKFACTAFDISSLQYLVSETEMEFVKVASSDWDNTPLLNCAFASELPIIQSIKEGAKLTMPLSGHKATMHYLHVVPEYPTLPSHAKLQRVTETWCSGLSDHSGDIVMPIAAVALGARIIESHLTLDKNLPGPDHKSSLDPHQFTAMVKAIRMVGAAL